MSNPDRLQKDIDDFEKYYFSNPHDVFCEYVTFSLFWQDAFVTSGHIDYGANLEFLYQFHNNIKKHPILWKFFRRVFSV